MAASQRMQYGALKYQIEQMRRHPSIVGYIITEFTDVNWECNGLLDMCRNPKAFYDRIGEINGADVIVPEWDPVSYWEGDRCEVHLTFSHFSSLELRNCRLVWQLGQHPAVHGEFTDITPLPAQRTPLGMIVLDVPRLERGTRARLEFTLFNGDGAQVTRNHLELYFFPCALGTPAPMRISAPPQLRTALRRLGYSVTANLEDADVAVAVRMTDQLRWYVQNGGHVLWLAESSESQQAYLGFDILERRSRRWQGDWANNFNWLRQDQMFGAIPSEHTVDFAFADLTPDYVIAGLSPRDFAADVHAGLFIGWLHHTVVLIVERRIGNGRMMVSTFRLQANLDTHPVAAIMLRDMLTHVSRATGSELRPASSLAAPAS